MANKTREARITLIEQKIARKEAEIAQLREQKEKLMHPVTMKDVLSKAKEAGLSARDIAEKLDLNI